MNPREKGFLLLSCRLGNADRRPLTQAQLQTLAKRVQGMKRPADNRDLSREDLMELGYTAQMADHILQLLSQEEMVQYYCSQGEKIGCKPVTWASPAYPGLLRQRLGTQSPGCLWAKGDLSLLGETAVSLVGSRDLEGENRRFAEAVGVMAARKGLVLVSGNARGADKAAQQACLEAGGRVICVVADDLSRQPEHSRILYLSEDGFREGFSAQRALSRNRCIHALGQITFVAQSTKGKGGTWSGTVKNLNHGWSSVVCFRDGSNASLELEQMGAYLMGIEDLWDITLPSSHQTSFFTD